MAKEDEVRLIAYRLWEEEGCPDGQDCNHWYRAEMIWDTNQKNAGRSSQSSAKKASSEPQRDSKSASKAKSAKKPNSARR